MLNSISIPNARSTSYMCMMSCMCSLCYIKGERNAFFGVPITGCIMGNTSKDKAFKSKVGKAFLTHMREEHRIEIVKYGKAYMGNKISVE